MIYGLLALAFIGNIGLDTFVRNLPLLPSAPPVSSDYLGKKTEK
jgi:hypothetical protein